MKNKALRFFLKFILPLVFWLGIWHILSILINNDFLLPGIRATFTSLLDLLQTKDFYIALMFSTARVVAGLSLGVVFGFLIGALCHVSELASSLILPAISIIKSTPVASFIIVLWVLMSGDALSVFIGFLMVMPLIAQTTLSGLRSIDPGLLEVADVFEFSLIKRLKLLIIPTIKQLILPAVITSTGLAWKAEIAAEIIAYTKNSIGQGINDAKYNLNTPQVFAWTIVIIAFSIVLEKIAKKILGRKHA